MNRLVGLAWRTRWGIATTIVFAVLLGTTVLLTRAGATNTENALWQFILFGVAAYLSYYFGKKSIKAGVNEVLRSHGRKSVRRIENLAAGIGDYATVIDKEGAAFEDVARRNRGKVPLYDAAHSLSVIRSQIDGEIRTAADAIEDWRDLVPEEVRELEQRKKQAKENNGHS